MPPPLDAAALARLSETLAKMTAGPWSWESIAEKSNEFAVGIAFDADGNQLAGRLPSSEHVEDSVIERRSLVGMNESGHANFADADGIVALVNAAPALIQMAQTLELIRQMRSGLEYLRDDSNDVVTKAVAHELLAALDAARVVKSAEPSNAQTSDGSLPDRAD